MARVSTSRGVASSPGEVALPRLQTPERTGAAFSFPYPTPYSIQLDLMTALFEAIEEGKIAVFESPTGTGKSLSLICATFTWLRANSKRLEKLPALEADALAANDDDDAPMWVREQAAEKRYRELMSSEKELKERIKIARMREAELRKRAARNEASSSAARMTKKMKTDSDGSTFEDGAGELEDDESFLPSSPTGPPPSWDPASVSHGLAASSDDANISPAVRALMAQFSAPSGGHSESNDLPETTPKIVYASRTHSQLTQFIGELKKTAFGKDVLLTDFSPLADDAEEAAGPVRVIALGSRKQMCIHEGVQKLGSKAGSEAMNEACRELISSKASSKGESTRGCNFLPPMDEQGRARVLEFRDRAMAEVRDIEDLVRVGKDMKTCPYYAARTSARQAELVTLPYNLLLQKTAREALGISLKDSVILVDESHNLIDTILSVYSCSITSAQVTTAKGQINEYLRRFGGRLRGESEMMLRMLRRLLEGLERAAKQWSLGKPPGNEEVWTAARVITEMGGNVDTINFGKLELFLKEGQIARKVSSYAEKAARKKLEKVEAAGAPPDYHQSRSKLKSIRSGMDKASTGLAPSAIAAMHSIEAFILSLSNRTKDGRVLLSILPEGQDRPEQADAVVQLKYQLLNPSESFQDLVDQARAIILAGGTMEPISDIRDQLVPSIPISRWGTFACGHIVPKENLFCSIVPSGPRGTPFEFTYKKRGDTAILDDLGNAIVNFSALIPYGIVVFLPSYKLLDEVVARWKVSGVWKRIETRKAIFTEPKSSAEVDIVLRAFSAEIDEAVLKPQSPVTGSLLLAVVGAKLSEGINFSDRLARAVIMVGMPFPNSQSPELAERMRYVREVAGSGKAAKSTTGADPGHALYLSLCLKAVNQSIGRAIRHQNDYASLILLDQRYSRTEIRRGLPGWIRDEVKVQDNFGTTMKDLGAWWRDKRAKGKL